MLDVFNKELKKSNLDFFSHSRGENDNLLKQTSDVEMENIRRKLLKSPPRSMKFNTEAMENEEESSRVDFKNMTSQQYFEKLSKL